MTNDKHDLKSEGYEEGWHAPRNSRSWIRLAAIAAASAMAGGLAAAWYYRKTLNRLNQDGQTPLDSKFGIIDERTDDESWHI